MGIFDAFRKKEYSLGNSFKTIPAKKYSTLECDGLKKDPTIKDVVAAVKDVIEGNSEFVIFTPAKAAGGIRFIQASCFTEDFGVLVQLAIERDGRMYLVEKTLSEKGALLQFQHVYAGDTNIDTSGYLPVDFTK